MTRAIKIAVLIMMIVLPYLYGEYSYRQHLGTETVQCVRVWEDESCHKGRDCRYTMKGRMLFDNGTTSVLTGNYTVGSFYEVKQEWKFIDISKHEPNIAQLYRAIMNLISIVIAIVIAIMLSMSTFNWLAFKSRYKNPLSLWVLFFGTGLDESAYKDRKFMDAHPYWFYKEGEEQ